VVWIKVSSWHIGIAAEAFAAGLFARHGYKVSVQYGANQPEYDLLVEKDDGFMKVSVKGSQDGSWGLTQSFKKDRTYGEAADIWLQRHGKKTILCLVQFYKTEMTEMPRVYLATPMEIADILKIAGTDTAKQFYMSVIHTRRVLEQVQQTYCR
jgi:Holliday junction resolvase-like predicted endonuclease